MGTSLAAAVSEHCPDADQPILAAAARGRFGEVEIRDRLVAAGQTQANFAVYPITIDFDQLPNTTAAQRQEQQQVKSIATSWTLQPGDVALLDKVAGELLWRHPCFRALVADIGLQGNPEAAAVPNTRCPVEPPKPAPPSKARPRTM